MTYYVAWIFSRFFFVSKIRQNERSFAPSTKKCKQTLTNFLVSFLKIHLWIFGRFCDDPRIEYPVACSIWRKKSVESNLDESERRSVLLCHSWLNVLWLLDVSSDTWINTSMTYEQSSMGFSTFFLNEMTEPKPKSSRLQKQD